MPAAAGLAAERDGPRLERVRYDGSRLHIGVLLPVGLLAWLYAGPFLSLWVDDRLGVDAAGLTPLMRLSLVGAVPQALGVPVQVAAGLGRVRVIAVAALAGSLANLPLCYYLAARLGVAGVIGGPSSRRSTRTCWSRASSCPGRQGSTLGPICVGPLAPRGPAPPCW